MKTEYERMIAGELYDPSHPELSALSLKGRLAIERYNQLSRVEVEERTKILHDTLGRIEGDCWIESPFRVDYGCNIYLGHKFYANFDCIMLDVAPIYIGHHVMFGPRVSLYTATHPIDAEVRNNVVEYGKPIRIGNECWLGGNVVVNPGVTIGDRTIIASGSVVTKDIPSDVIAGGNPCRVIRKITAEDKVYWKAQEADYFKSKKDAESVSKQMEDRN